MDDTENVQNYYGSLCTEMYEKLHEKAPEDELEFYLSYAAPGMRILEPLCGSGRFLVPFEQAGLYELKEGGSLLRSETMDFRIRLYQVGEMERILDEIGFSSVRAYSSFDKTGNPNNDCDCFIYECRP